MFFINDNISHLQFDNLSCFSEQITHFVTTRNAGEDNRFTIGINDYQPLDVVVSNRIRIAQKFGFEINDFVFAEQVHGNMVEVITPEMKGKGALSKADSLPHSDGWITNQPGICLVAQSADCVPILFYDPIRHAIGAAHAGWRGTVKKVALCVVKTMQEVYGTNPQNIVVGIGPSIGPCCYEVGIEVAEQVERSFPSHQALLLYNQKNPKPIFNLWKANYTALLEAGVKPENIEIAEICTKCNNSYFFSARAGDRGRFGGFIMLKKHVKN